MGRHSPSLEPPISPGTSSVDLLPSLPLGWVGHTVPGWSVGLSLWDQLGAVLATGLAQRRWGVTPPTIRFAVCVYACMRVCLFGFDGIGFGFGWSHRARLVGGFVAVGPTWRCSAYDFGKKQEQRNFQPESDKWLA